MGEANRLGFLVARDGPDAALAFATATMLAYRRAILETPASLYRRPLIESYLALKRFVVGRRRGVPVPELLDQVEARQARVARRLARGVRRPSCP